MFVCRCLQVLLLYVPFYGAIIQHVRLRKKGARLVWTLTGITCIAHSVAVDDAW